MGQGRQRQPGKIGALRDFLDAHESAVRYDLVKVGKRLEDVGKAYSWHDLWALIQFSDHTSAVYRSTQGHGWGLETSFLALLADQLNQLTWLTSRVHGGRTSRPKKIQRPASLAKGEDAPEKTMGKSADLDDIKAFLERKNGR